MVCATMTTAATGTGLLRLPQASAFARGDDRQLLLPTGGRTLCALAHTRVRACRQYTARKLRRLRAGKTIKFLHRGRSTGHEWQPRVLSPEDVTDVRHLQLPLFNAERAWSYASELKTDENPQYHGRRQHHMERRLRRAALWTDSLRALCEARGDDRTSLEAEAYGAEMWANYLFVKSDWKRAKEQFSRAKQIYEHMSVVGGADTRELFKNKVDADITPALRWCTHQLRTLGKDDSTETADDGGFGGSAMSSDLLRAKLEAVRADTRRKAAGKVSGVDWRGRTLPIPDEEVRLAILTTQEAEVAQEQAVAACEEGTGDEKALDSAYMALLGAYEDARTSIATLKLDALKTERTVVAEQLANLEAYVNHKKLCGIVNHQLWLVEAAEAALDELEAAIGTEGGSVTAASDKAAELVNLLTVAQRTVTHAQTTATVAEAAELRSRGTSLTAKRARFLARHHAMHGKWAEAHALFALALSHTATARKALDEVTEAGGTVPTGGSHGEEDTFAASVAEVDALEAALRVEVVTAHARGVTAGATADSKLGKNLAELALPSAGAIAAAPPGISVLQRIDEYKSGDVAALPPALEPVPAKPLHFDLAFAELQFPDLSQRVRKARPKKKPASRPAPAAAEKKPATGGAGAASSSASATKGGGGSKGTKQGTKKQGGGASAGTRAPAAPAPAPKEEEKPEEQQGGGWLSGWFGGGQ